MRQTILKAYPNIIKQKIGKNKCLIFLYNLTLSELLYSLVCSVGLVVLVGLIYCL